MFDNDPEKIGVPVGDIPVYSMEEMPNFLKENMPDIAVLAPVSYTHLDVYKRQVCALWELAPRTCVPVAVASLGPSLCHSC